MNMNTMNTMNMNTMNTMNMMMNTVNMMMNTVNIMGNMAQPKDEEKFLSMMNVMNMIINNEHDGEHHLVEQVAAEDAEKVTPVHLFIHLFIYLSIFFHNG